MSTPIYSEHRVVSARGFSASIWLGGLDSRSLNEVYFVMDLNEGLIRRLEFDTVDIRRSVMAHVETVSPRGIRPYGLEPLGRLASYFLHPHSFICSGSSMLVFMKQAPYFRRIELSRFHSELLPSHGDLDRQFSSTNCVADDGTIWLSSTSCAQRMHKYADVSGPMSGAIWNFDQTSGELRLSRVVRGVANDSIHQIACVGSDGIIMIDMVVSTAEHPDPPPGTLAEHLDIDVSPGIITVADPHSEEFAQFDAPGMCPAHTVGLRSGDVVLSCHGISKFGTDIVVRCPASLHRYHIRGTDVEPRGAFSHPKFYRITTHCVATVEGEEVIVAAAYPNTLWLVRAADMVEIGTIELFPCDDFRAPFICPKSVDYPNFLFVSDASGLAIAVGSKTYYVVDLSERRILSRVRYDSGGFTATAHLGVSPIWKM